MTPAEHWAKHDPLPNVHSVVLNKEQQMTNDACEAELKHYRELAEKAQKDYWALEQKWEQLVLTDEALLRRVLPALDRGSEGPDFGVIAAVKERLGTP